MGFYIVILENFVVLCFRKFLLTCYSIMGSPHKQIVIPEHHFALTIVQEVVSLNEPGMLIQDSYKMSAVHTTIEHAQMFKSETEFGDFLGYFKL